MCQYAYVNQIKVYVANNWIKIYRLRLDSSAFLFIFRKLYETSRSFKLTSQNTKILPLS